MNFNLTTVDNPVIPKPGIYYDISWEEYQGWNCMRKSFVADALKSGQHLLAKIEGQTTTKSMKLGSVIDCLVLEPHLFNKMYTIQPSTYDSTKTTGRGANKVTVDVVKPWNMRSNTCKQIHADIVASGKRAVSGADYEKAVLIKESLMQNNEICKIINESEKQVSVVWKQKDTEVLCKARLDLWHMPSETIYDLKSSVDASREGFARFVGKFDYHVQESAYLEAINALTGKEYTFKFIVAETSFITKYPLVTMHYLGSDSRLAGNADFKRACNKILEYENDGFGGYPKDSRPIEISQWMINRSLELDEEFEITIGGQTERI